MRYFKIIMAFVLVTGITACGGGGGGSGSVDNGGGISVDNNSNTDIVFDDSLKSKWGKFRAYEYNYSTGGITYDDGQSANFLQWKVVQSASAGHNSVIEINYAMQDQRWAQFHISPVAPQDLSIFESGIFSFDINMIEWGDAYDSTTGTATFQTSIECGWPCASHAINIVINSTNTWKHVEINVADFVASGADLTKLDSTFIIKPLIGYQKGARYQLDNIQWKKGPATIKKKVIFEEHFNTSSSGNAWASVPVYGINAPPHSVVSEGLFLAPSFVGPFYDNFAIEATLANTININHKKISLQFKPDVAMIGPSALEFVATDTSGRTASTPRINMAALTPLVWNLVKFDVDTAGTSADSGFDSAVVKKLKLVFYSNGQLVGSTSGSFFMDEIIITE